MILSFLTFCALSYYDNSCMCPWDSFLIDLANLLQIPVSCLMSWRGKQQVGQ